MALSATFTANFSSFYDAVEKATVKLDEFKGGADKAGDRLNKMAQSFSGQKIVQEAMLMVKAIDGVEGITKLTDKEMERLGATTNEAVAKLKVLGKDVPKDLQAVADATKNANQKTVDWKSSLVGLAGAMGIAFSVDAIVGFAKGIFSLASDINDLSNQWGVSIEAVQEFTKAAESSGVAATTVGKAIQFMSGELAGTDPLFTKLIGKLGLSKEALAAMPQEEAFRKIIDGLMTIDDENERLRYGIKLLGPAWKEMAGAAADGFVEASRHQETFSKNEVKRLAAAEAAWKDLYNHIVIFSGEAMVKAMENTETLTSSWKNFFGFIAAEMKKPGAGGGIFLQQQAAAAKLAAQLKTTTTTLTTTGKAAGVLGGSFLSVAAAEEEVKKDADAAKRALDAQTKAMADAKAKAEAFRKEVEAQQRAVTDLSRSLSGNGLIEQAIKYLSALETSIPIQRMTAEKQAEINKVMANAIDVYVSAGEQIPKAMLDTWVATKIATDRVIDFNFSLDELKKRYLDLNQLPKFDPFTVTGNPNVPLPEPPHEDQLPAIIKNIRTLGQAMGDLGAVTGGAFGEVLTAGADIAWAFDQATVSLEGMKTGLASIKAGKTTAGLTSVAAAGMQVASSFLAATQGAGMMQSILTGAAMGASLAPGPYMGYAAAAGAVVGVLRGFNNMQAEDSAVAQLRGQMLQAIPTSMDFRKEVEAAGYTLQGFADADTIVDLKHEYDLLVKAIEANQMREAFIETAGGLDALRKAAELANFDITQLMAASGKDLQAEIDALSEAFRFQDESMATLIETAERYGFTLEELGPAFTGQQLDKQAQQLYKDWEVLNAAGIETVDITRRMGESVSDYVNMAMKMGFEVPNAMKPMLEEMAKAGQLTDASGEKISDLEKSGVKFSLTMSDGFKRLIDVVEKLTESISISLGLAIRNVPQPKIQGKVTWDVDDPRGAASNANNTQEAGKNSFARGTDGFRNFGTGTPVVLHGWEAVVPRGDAASLATIAAPSMAPSGGGGAAPAIIINAQGAFFDTPDSLQRLAGKVSDALTAKYSVMGKLRAAV